MLVELGSLFLPKAWEHEGSKLVWAFAGVLDLCIANGKDTVKRSALVVARRAVRQLCEDAIVAMLVSHLSAKDQPLGYRTSLLLGVIAGVCARKNKLALEAVKYQYYAFYVREVIGSRQPVPRHITIAFDDFFSNFATAADLGKEVVPALERGLLRAPEVVLYLLPHLVQSWPRDIDTAEILARNLLKLLQSNVKSQNPVLRNGALSAFSALAERARDGQCLDKTIEEISGSLSKATSADQRSIYAQMLGFLPILLSKAGSVRLALTQTAIREPNEAALEAEVSTLTAQLSSVLLSCSSDHKLTKSLTEVYIGGLGDKKPIVRKIWAVGVGELLWKVLNVEHHDASDCRTEIVDAQQSLDKQPNGVLPNNFQQLRSSSLDPYEESFCPQSKATISRFMESVVPRLLEIFEEVLQNPLISGQLTAAAFVTAAILPKMPESLLPEAIKAKVLKTRVPDRTLSTLFNHRVYTKLNLEDLKWIVRALAACASQIWKTKASDPINAREIWAQTLIYLITAAGVPISVRKEATTVLTATYLREPANTGEIIIEGLWSWSNHVQVMEKDTAAMAAKTGTSHLFLVVRSIFPPMEAPDAAIMQAQLINILVLSRPEILPKVHWIETCLRVGQDPGEIAQTKAKQCLGTIDRFLPPEPVHGHSTTIERAAYNAGAELAFVAPDAIIPRLVERVRLNLPAHKVALYGPREIAIARTPEGTAFVDVLGIKGQAYNIDKNSRDYDTMKWEEEVRSQIAQKKGHERKLTGDERAKVNAQLAKESLIRQEVYQLENTIRNGVGFVRALADGPPTDAGLWLGPSLRALIEAIVAGAGRLVGNAADEAFLACSKFVSSRLGSLRAFLGIATLRALGSSSFTAELLEEPLADLVTRMLYRLHSASAQRPFDSISLIYSLPLVFTVLRQSGIGQVGIDEADEQITLALEILLYHSDMFTDKRLPRDETLALLIGAMQRYSQHYKLIKDCLADVCRAIGGNASEQEIATLVKGGIVPQISVRTAVLQAIREDLDLTDLDFSEEVWLACHDDVEENSDLGHAIWKENALEVSPAHAMTMVQYLASKDKQIRRAASRALAEAIGEDRNVFSQVLDRLESEYRHLAKPRVAERDAFGMIKKTDLADTWENRSGIALAFKAMTPTFETSKLVPFVEFLIKDSALGDRNATVRDEMIDSATTVIRLHGAAELEELMRLFETALDDADKKSRASDLVNEAVIILYGALAGHLQESDERVPKVIQRLLSTLDTPSETVQYAVAGCLPALIQVSGQRISDYLQIVLDKLLQSKKYAARRGAAYGLAGIVKGRGVSVLREHRIMSTLKSAIDNKKEQNHRQGALFAYELLALILGRTFEPYIIQIVPQLLATFGDATADVREACLDTAKTCFANLSSYGVKIILPTLLEGLEESQWRSKKGACDLLGAMAYLDPQQLALSLPDIIPPLTGVLNDSHKEVRASANRSLQRFGEVISNPEIRACKYLAEGVERSDQAHR